MAKTTNQGRNSKRASALRKQQQREWQQTFKACHGNPKKVKAAAADYRKKYGATPSSRWKNALRAASGSKQTRLKLR